MTHESGHNPLSLRRNRMLKRSFDLVFSSFSLLLSPLVVLPVAVAIKLTSRGPVFFTQKRTGRGGRCFSCYKFRTMFVNEEADTLQAFDNDPRITAVGRCLRRTSIDELPQLLNVWRGDMSLVGPRPHMLLHTAQYSTTVDSYMERHAVKPGITGWAQVNGLRGPTDELWKMTERVRHDLWYVRNWSFALDMRILWRTLRNAVTKRT